MIDLRADAETSALADVLRTLWRDVRSPLSFVIVLRLFIGVGWIRAGAGKLFSPTWLNGSEVADFINDQLAAGAVVYTTAADVMRLLEPHAGTLAWVIGILEVAAGVGILFGILTNGALAVGILMNVMFMVAGAPNPSAFYIVIQLVLLMTGAGAICGADRWLYEDSRGSLLPARPPGTPIPVQMRIVLGVIAAVLAVACLLTIRAAQELAVGDATAVLGFTLGILGLGSALAAVRVDGADPSVS